MQVIYNRTTKFVMILQSLAKDKSLTYRDKIVYMTLCLYSDNTSKQSHPSSQTIEDVANTSRHGVFRALKSQKSAGYIRRVKRTTREAKQTTNVYYLLDK